jgi:integrase
VRHHAFGSGVSRSPRVTGMALPSVSWRTAVFYRHLLDNIIKPELGAIKADKVTRTQIARLHGSLKKTPFQANRVLAVIGSMYTFAGRTGVVPEGVNPARRIEQFKEHRRERFLSGGELQQLGSAIREAETKGIPWDVDEQKPKAKHLPKAKNRFTKIGPFAAAAIRLLLFTGCRLREILHLKWEQVGPRTRAAVSRRLQDRQEDCNPQCSGALLS